MNFGIHVGVHVATMILQRLAQCQQIGFAGLGSQQSHGASDHLASCLTQSQSLRRVHFCIANFGRLCCFVFCVWCSAALACAQFGCGRC